MPERFKAAAQQAVGTLFAQYAEFLVAGEYQREGAALAQVKFLAMPVPAALVDGTIVQPNDEKLLFDAVELAAVTQPRPGDGVVQATTGLSRDIITAHLDVTGSYWAMVARKKL
ncbi:MAG: hypothetical protein RLY20_2234 [Verrucomicrobiota bacterium]